MMDSIVSPSGKYIVNFEKDTSDEQIEYKIISKDEIIHKTKDKYYIAKLMDISQNKIIYTYKIYNTYKPLSKFITINNQEWWFSGRHYMLRLFVNCDTGEIYDDPNNIENDDFYKYCCEYIWGSIADVSSDGKYILVDGCYWACPYEWRIYDISNLKNGYIEIDLLNDITFCDNGESKIDDYDVITDSDTYKLKFNLDNKVSIYKGDEYICDFIINNNA